jgi:hypothetical protein
MSRWASGSPQPCRSRSPTWHPRTQPCSRPASRCSSPQACPAPTLVVEQVESTPTQTCFCCTLATIERHSPEVNTTVAQQTLPAVATVIVTVSTLPDDQWKVLLDQAFEQDLPSSAAFAMPYDSAFQTAARNHHLRLTLREQRPLASHDTACPGAGPGLDFPSTPGPGYTLSSTTILSSRTRSRVDQPPLGGQSACSGGAWQRQPASLTLGDNKPDSSAASRNPVTIRPAWRTAHPTSRPQGSQTGPARSVSGQSRHSK